MIDRARREFEEFVAARGPALQRAAYLMVGDTGLAQDLVQEALVKTYVAWPRLREVANAEAYTRKAITTTAISWSRRRGWRAERPTVQLPDRGSGDHAEAQTAETMGCAVGTVKSQVSAALVTLRARVGADLLIGEHR